MSKRILISLTAAAALLASTGAFADSWKRGHGNGWGHDRHEHRHHYRHHEHERHGYWKPHREKVVVRHYAPVVRHVYAPPPVVVYHEPAYVVPGAVVGATPYGWTMDLRFGGGWR
jgi:hypothetical protein